MRVTLLRAECMPSEGRKTAILSMGQVPVGSLGRVNRIPLKAGSITAHTPAAGSMRKLSSFVAWMTRCNLFSTRRLQVWCLGGASCSPVISSKWSCKLLAKRSMIAVCPLLAHHHHILHMHAVFLNISVFVECVHRSLLQDLATEMTKSWDVSSAIHMLRVSLSILTNRMGPWTIA